MRALSKSKIMAFRQCPKRLWLELHHPELREDSANTKARFEAGNQVGDIARQLFDPAGKGVLINRERDGSKAALTLSAELLKSSQPVFEAGFSSEGALAFADVMLPAKKAGRQGWRMIEVKSSTSVKDYHREDIAIQAFVAINAGVKLVSAVVAYLDNTWKYPGNGKYQGLLKESDLTDEALGRSKEVKEWIADATTIANKRNEPAIKTGRHCTTPYSCGFLDYCQSQEPQAKYPVTWLPRIQTKALKALIEDDGIIDLRKVPDELLNERQRRVKTHTLSGKSFFDADGAAAILAAYQLPAYFLDFETINFAVPIWKSARPYQQISFQFSVHKLSPANKIEHFPFLDLSGNDPSGELANMLIAACGKEGPVFVYNAKFEKGRINELAERFPKLKDPLLAINARIVDLQPVAEQFYYHPSQEGSWSLKKVSRAIEPGLSYDALNGVQDGDMAMDAYKEAISPLTTEARKLELREQLLAYCKLDTTALIHLLRFFIGRQIGI